MNVRRCSRCYFRKPLSYFHARERHADGTPRTYQSRCKACMREVNREVNGHRPRPPALTREERLTRKRIRYAERMAEISADPLALADWREYIRVKEKLRREKQGAKPYPPRRHWNNGVPVAGAYEPISYKDAVDAAPFFDFVAEWFPDASPEQIQSLLGISSRHYDAWLETGHATLSAIDRALTKGLGRPDLLNVLYPYEPAPRKAPQPRAPFAGDVVGEYQRSRKARRAAKREVAA